jgi:hypothetical protein
MDEVKLADKDYDSIMDYALNDFRDKIAPRTIRGSNFLSKCYVSAMLGYFKTKGWTVRDGKIYESEKT